MDNHEKIEAKREEMKEKYADVINDLATKYEKDLGVGFDMLEAIARAKINNEETDYGVCFVDRRLIISILIGII